MIEFNPEKKDDLSFDESLSPAMRITKKEDAERYFNGYVTYIMEKIGEGREEAEFIAKENLGYYAGYYDNKTRERVEKLFSCAHPIFGSVKENGHPTVMEALHAGMALATRIQSDPQPTENVDVPEEETN